MQLGYLQKGLLSIRSFAAGMGCMLPVAVVDTAIQGHRKPEMLAAVKNLCGVAFHSALHAGKVD